MLASGCGSSSSDSGSSARQADETGPHTYKIEVLDVTFKPDQQVGRPATMRIEVLNADTRAIPNIAVTSAQDRAPS